MKNILNVREGYFWAIQMRPIFDSSGESDVIIATPLKSHTKDRCGECMGQNYYIVWNGWIKYGKAALKRIKYKGK